MNGAIAEPSTNMTSPPTRQAIKITGVSQNFLRLRRKTQSSPAKLNIGPSKLPGIEVCRSPCRPLGSQNGEQQVVAAPELAAFAAIGAHLCRRGLSHPTRTFFSCLREWRPQPDDQ